MCSLSLGLISRGRGEIAFPFIDWFILMTQLLHLIYITNLEAYDTCSSWGILIFYDISLVILSLVLHSSFKQCCPLGSGYLVGRVSSIGL